MRSDDNIDEIASRIKNLISEIRLNDKLYYQESAPLISDSEYDDIKKKLKNLINLHKDALEKAGYSFDDAVGYSPDKENFSLIKHNTPMLSLNNVFDDLGFIDFLDRVRKLLNAEGTQFSCQPKVDGISFSALYEEGEIVYASTRGNGKEGENITNNFLTISEAPKRINFKQKLEIRGEIYIDREDFISMNQKLEEEGKKIFANPRNAASGSIRQLDRKVTMSRPLKYIVWDAIIKDEELTDHSKVLKKVQTIGFNTVPCLVLSKLEEMKEYYVSLEEKRATIPYDIDGVVYKVDSLMSQNKLSNTSSAPRWAIAYKFSPQVGETKLNDISLQISRYGTITPVAELSPINIGGVIISRATLHNFEEIKKNDFRINDIVKVKRSGDVIPKIISVHQRGENSETYCPPQVCPSCESHLTQNGAYLSCTNSLCEEKIIQSIIHFVSKGAMNIVGLSDKQVRYLYSLGLIKSYIDVIKLADDSAKIAVLKGQKGWGERSIEELIESILRARKSDIARFLLSLNIKYMGAVAAEKIACLFSSREDFLEFIKNSDVYDEVIVVPGIGEKIAASLADYIAENRDSIIELAQELEMKPFTKTENNEVGVASIFRNRTVAFTGTLSQFTRDEAKEIVKSHGALIRNSVSKNLDYLVIGEGTGKKAEEAAKYGVKVLEEDEFIQIIEAD